MPASLPGALPAQNLANPSQGTCVTFDLLSGPKGSPFDKDTVSGTTNNCSTGALSTGIGFGGLPVINTTTHITQRGYTDDYTPGVSKVDATSSPDSTYMYIGGGRCNPQGVVVPGSPTYGPYTAGFGIGMAGNGGSRDAGAGPAFTGFTIKLVTATGSVANGAAVETGFTNRSNATLASGQSVFGSNTTASAAVA